MTKNYKAKMTEKWQTKWQNKYFQDSQPLADQVLPKAIPWRMWKATALHPELWVRRRNGQFRASHLPQWLQVQSQRLRGKHQVRLPRCQSRRRSWPHQSWWRSTPATARDHARSHLHLRISMESLEWLKEKDERGCKCRHFEQTGLWWTHDTSAMWHY